MTALLWIMMGLGTVCGERLKDAWFYHGVERSDTSKLLEVVEALPMRVFELEHDSVVGRRHFGAIGDALDRLLPEAVKIGPRVVRNATINTFVDSFAHVDGNVLFMHGVGAVQELAKRENSLSAQVWAAKALADNSSSRFETVRVRIDAGADEGDEQRVRDELLRREELQVEEGRLDEEARIEAEAIKRRDAIERKAATAEDDAARGRIRSEDAAERDRHSERLRLQEESTARQEAQKRQMDAAMLQRRLENERELEKHRREAELARVKAEAEAEAAAERENEPLRLRAMRAKMAEDRKRLLDAVALVASYIGRGAAALLDDPRALGTVALAIVALISGGFFSREAAKLARSLAEAYLGRPRLVRETSRKRFARASRLTRDAARFFSTLVTSALHLAVVSMPVAFRHGLRCLRLWVALLLASTPDSRMRLRRAAMDAANAAKVAKCAARELEKAKQRVRFLAEHACFLNGVVLPASLQDRLLQLAIANSNAKKNGAPFRHMLLHGPPGTGKTLCAKRLAKASGLEYALMSGGDVGPLGADGVTALHALFRWARTSDTGVLIFIDEAEAFLASRSRARLTEHMRNALNAFLYQTGSPTHSFLLVLATNRAQDLDEAVLDRVDETLYFDIPTYRERASLVRLYYEAYVAALAKQRGRLSTFLQAFLSLPAPLDISDNLDDAALKAATDATDGFSGREIEKLMVAVQSAAYGDGAKLDADSFLAVVKHKSREHAYKITLDASVGEALPAAKNEALPFMTPRDKLVQERREIEIIAKMNATDGFLAELEGNIKSRDGNIGAEDFAFD